MDCAPVALSLKRRNYNIAYVHQAEIRQKMVQSDEGTESTKQTPKLLETLATLVESCNAKIVKCEVRH